MEDLKFRQDNISAVRVENNGKESIRKQTITFKCDTSL